MTAILKVDTIQDTSGNNIINESSDTITIGASGDTISIPSGATIANSGTATGFGIDGITQADQWRMSANRGNGVNSDITANLERVDDGSFGYIGNGMTESSGIFTFPATGIYQVSAVGMIYSISDSSTFLEMYVTTNNSSYDIVVNMNGGNNNSGATNLSIGGNTLVNVTNTSNVKVKFATSSMGGSSSLSGDTSSNYTYFTFIRLGDST
jgi:hypothetical protein